MPTPPGANGPNTPERLNVLHAWRRDLLSLAPHLAGAGPAIRDPCVNGLIDEGVVEAFERGRRMEALGKGKEKKGGKKEGKKSEKTGGEGWGQEAEEQWTNTWGKRKLKLNVPGKAKGETRSQEKNAEEKNGEEKKGEEKKLVLRLKMPPKKKLTLKLNRPAKNLTLKLNPPAPVVRKITLRLPRRVDSGFQGVEVKKEMEEVQQPSLKRARQTSGAGEAGAEERCPKAIKLYFGGGK